MKEKTKKYSVEMQEGLNSSIGNREDYSWNILLAVVEPFSSFYMESCP